MKFPLILITLDEKTFSLYSSKEELELQIEVDDIELFKVFDSDACLYRLDVIKETPKKLLRRLILGSRNVVRIAEQLLTTEEDRRELKNILLSNLKGDGIITSQNVRYDLVDLIQLCIEHKQRYSRHY